MPYRTRPTRTTLALALACSFTLSPIAGAENSPPLSDGETAALAASKRPSDAMEEYIAYMLELDQRYKDAGGIPADRLLEEEGETVALLYCRANGIDGPCAPTTTGTTTRYATVRTTEPHRWWGWLEGHTTHIGVIPEMPACPAPYALVEIFMDDENNANNNGRSGWIGATVSNNDTRWRFCKLDIPATNQFRRMNPQAPKFTGPYAVQSFGMVCPFPARRVVRYQDNQDFGNNNSTTGSVFPNLVTSAGSWMVTCHYDIVVPFFQPMMDFPQLPLHYGVYADHQGVTPLGAPLHPVGKVYQDDEDIANLNFWLSSSILGPNGTMWGTTNTERRLMKAF